ncbi:MAG: PspC domain-containing protein [Alphaproteobacteria bacterium]|nr:PspC domain-containing protein [Alphaproteobacteria bacterium]
MRKRFVLDKANGKVLGVCAGIARMTGWDVTIVRVATVVAALVVHPLVIVYFVAGLVAARAEPRDRYDDDAPARRARMSTYEMKRTMGDYDRRLAEIDSCMASANSPLAREIEQLR